MRRCGFRQGATPAAVANLARQWRRQLRSPGFRKLAAVMAQLAARAEVMGRLGGALEVSLALARVGAHPTLPRIATADFDSVIRALGFFKKSGN
jgi:hypothetical protein